MRKTSRRQRIALSEPERCHAATMLKQNFLALNISADTRKIAMYLANDGEINTQSIMHWCWQNERQTYVPVIGATGDAKLLFAPVTAETSFNKNRFSINEPVVPPEALIDANSLDLVLTPLVAFDRAGSRIGMGGGYYDTTFSFIKNATEKRDILVGVAYEFQCVESIQVESWDIPLHTVITDKNVYRF